MPNIYIDGFLPGDTKTSIRIYDSAAFGTENACELWAGSPNSAGFVSFKLSRSMVGRSIQLTAVGGEAKYYGVTLLVSRLGVFHTASLEFDRVLHSGENPFTPKLQQEAEARVLKLHRNAKYNNYFLTLIFAVATIASVYVGLLISGIFGLAAGALLTIVSLLLGNYASGWSRGF